VRKLKPFVRLLFPVLILLTGLVIYKILGYEPSIYTVLINIGSAFVLSPRMKKIQTENGTEEQFRWLFYKKMWK
jgi:hypothetical protein